MDGNIDSFHCFTTSSTKWTRVMEPIASVHQITYDKKKKQYSDSEVNKLIEYEQIAYNIVDTVQVGPDDHVFIEGFAQRASGQIIDLVVFSTFLRKRILDRGAKLTVVAPMALKKAWAELIYPKDKKGVARNFEINPKTGLGIAGGSFKKHQMMLGLYEMQDTSKFKLAMEMYRDEIMPLANIPSPLNDCVDAFAAAYLGKRKLI